MQTTAIVVDNINKLLKEHGMSRSELARRAQVEPTNMSKYLGGKITIETVEKFAAGLGVPVWQLFTPDAKADAVPAFVKKETPLTEATELVFKHFSKYVREMEKK